MKSNDTLITNLVLQELVLEINELYEYKTKYLKIIQCLDEAYSNNMDKKSIKNLRNLYESFTENKYFE